MKLIIDIPDWKYKSICEGIEASKRCGVIGTDPDVHEAIYKGIPYEERPQGEWIPVSERLPEEGKSVLVCIKTQGGMSQYVSERFNGNNWSALGGRTPIAWQPLPKPYKRGEEE